MDRFLPPQNDKVLQIAGSRPKKVVFKFLKIAVKIKCNLQFTPTEQRLTKA